MDDLIGTFVLEYSTISKILTDYYEKKYPGKNISCKAYSKESSQPDAWGFYDNYDIEAYIEIKSTSKVLGQLVTFESREMLYYGEIFEIVKDTLNNALKQEGNDNIIINSL